MKNMKYFFIGLFAVSLFTFQISAQDAEDVKKQIEENQASFMENFNKGDAEASSKYFAGDAIVSPPNAPEVMGKEAIVKLWQSFIDMGKAAVKLNTVNIEVSGKIAVVYQTYHFEAAMENGQEIKDDGKSIVVYKEQEDGTWLIIYDMWNSNLPLPTSN